jgi:NAD(P)-dependent dehydrogenase (short-subunit alcohol dehydrogenase family)
VLGGLASAVGPTWVNLDEEALLRNVVETGRRTLGLRSPRNSRKENWMKTAVVTGGGSGIGQAIATRLGADGYHVAIIDLNPGDDGFAYAADVTDRAQVDAALTKIGEKLSPVSVLVNAAGVDGFKPLTDILFDDWQRAINVNLHGVFHCIQAVLPT